MQATDVAGSRNDRLRQGHGNVESRGGGYISIGMICDSVHVQHPVLPVPDYQYCQQRY